MSRATVDLRTYRRLLRGEFFRLRNKGLSSGEAVTQAFRNITSAFDCADDIGQVEFQKDHDDARRDNEWA